MKVDPSFVVLHVSLAVANSTSRERWMGEPDGGIALCCLINEDQWKVFES